VVGGGRGGAVFDGDGQATQLQLMAIIRYPFHRRCDSLEITVLGVPHVLGTEGQGRVVNGQVCVAK